MIKNLRTFWFVFLLYIRQSLYHKSAAAGIAVTWVVRIGLTVLLYQQIYRLTGNGAIKGINITVAISGMLFFGIFLGFGFRELARQINRENRSGNLEVWFMKPLPYLYLKIGETFGTTIMAAMVLVFLASLCGIVYAHTLQADYIIWRFACCFILLLTGLVIATLLYCLIGLSSIFLGDMKAVENIVSKIAMIFGGAYVPVGFFPEGLRIVAEMLPVTAMTFGGQFLYPDFFANLPRFILVQFTWIIILYIAVWKINKIAHKHLTVNGG